MYLNQHDLTMPCVCPAAQLLSLCTSGISFYLLCWSLGTIFHTQVFLYVLCHFRTNCWIEHIHFCSWGDRIKFVIFFVQQKSQWYQGNRPTQYLFTNEKTLNFWHSVILRFNLWTFMQHFKISGHTYHSARIQCGLLDGISYCTQE